LALACARSRTLVVARGSTVHRSPTLRTAHPASRARACNQKQRNRQAPAPRAGPEPADRALESSGLRREDARAHQARGIYKCDPAANRRLPADGRICAPHAPTCLRPASGIEDHFARSLPRCTVSRMPSVTLPVGQRCGCRRGAGNRQGSAFAVG
jgi:hypothetical protein